jgi:ribonuclease P protein component
MKIFGLSKKERITKAGEFEHAYKNGVISKSGCLIIRSRPNNLKYSRLGVAVSKKLFPSAVARNRIKRLIREAFRLNKHQLPRGLDLIVGVRPKGPNPFTLQEIQNGLIGSFTNHP